MSNMRKLVIVVLFLVIFQAAIVLASTNPTRNDALTSLLQAEQDIQEMDSFGLQTYYVTDLLLMAKRHYIGDQKELIKTDIQNEKDIATKKYLEDLYSYAQTMPLYDIEQLNYSETIRLSTEVHTTKTQAYHLLDSISIIETKQQNYLRDGIDTTTAEELIAKAKKSHQEERYNETEAFLNEANGQLDTLLIENKRLNILKKSKNFIQNNWISIVVVIMLIAIISPFAYKVIRKERAKKKLKNLLIEQETTQKLIVQTQKDYIQNKTISKDTYTIRTQKYRNRLIEINSLIPATQAIIDGKKRKTEKKKRGVIEIK